MSSGYGELFSGQLRRGGQGALGPLDVVSPWVLVSPGLAHVRANGQPPRVNAAIIINLNSMVPLRNKGPDGLLVINTLPLHH